MVMSDLIIFSTGKIHLVDSQHVVANLPSTFVSVQVLAPSESLLKSASRASIKFEIE